MWYNFSPFCASWNLYEKEHSRHWWKRHEGVKKRDEIKKKNLIRNNAASVRSCSSFLFSFFFLSFFRFLFLSSFLTFMCLNVWEGIFYLAMVSVCRIFDANRIWVLTPLDHWCGDVNKHNGVACVPYSNYFKRSASIKRRAIWNWKYMGRLKFLDLQILLYEEH